ncbi:MAG: hypothetical protein ACYDBQ_12780, partial [Thermoplasmatota archaeon]
TAAKHQKESGAGWFDALLKVVAPDDPSLLALPDATEAHFDGPERRQARPLRAEAKARVPARGATKRV